MKAAWKRLHVRYDTMDHIRTQMTKCPQIHDIMHSNNFSTECKDSKSMEVIVDV